MPEEYVEPLHGQDSRLGRLIEFDLTSTRYPIRSLLGPRSVLQSKEWPCFEYLDQGNVGACVGFSCEHDIAADPVMLPVSHNHAMQIYKEAQRIDPWPGEDYEGTSVLAGVKTLKAMGYISEYRWAFSIDDVLDTLANYGPVIFGINWYSGMFYPNAAGVINPSGSLAGGHAILGVGYNHEHQLVHLHNSWGQGWGRGGDCWISVANLTRLLNERGEACVPVVRTDPNPQPTYVAFSMVGSNVYHDYHVVRGTLDRRYTSFEEARAAGKRRCLVCRPG